MDMSLFLAKFFGFYLIIISVAMLLNAKTYLPIIREMINNQKMMLFSGIIALVFGLILVIGHNIWVPCWQAVISVISWIILLKGLSIILFPQASARFYNKFMAVKYVFEITLAIALVAGVYLLIIAYAY